MLTIAVKNVWAHKRRLVGTLVAVVLGVAFLSGTLLLSDTLRANFDTLFAQANGNTDLVVRSTTKIGTDPRQTRRAGVDVSLVDQVRRVAGVAEAVPYVEGYGQLVGRDGKSVGGNG